VRDEVLSGLSLLVGVPLACEAERLRDPRLVDRLDRVVGVLGDQREEVDQELAFLIAESLCELFVRDSLRPFGLDQADANVRIGQAGSRIGVAVRCVARS
jgi:hypothetical protein